MTPKPTVRSVTKGDGEDNGGNDRVTARGRGEGEGGKERRVGDGGREREAQHWWRKGRKEEN